jgi:uncharacterized BrkB/YihY/UPF0761 family membrane protein
MERKLGPYVAMLVALLGGALIVVTVFLYFLVASCPEYCEPEERPGWDGFETALPFGMAAIAVLTVAAYLFMIGPPVRRPTWPRALVVAVGSCAAGALVVVAFATWYDELPGEVAAWVAGIGAVIVWDAMTGVAARALAVRS